MANLNAVAANWTMVKNFLSELVWTNKQERRKRQCQTGFPIA